MNSERVACGGIKHWQFCAYYLPFFHASSFNPFPSFFWVDLWNSRRNSTIAGGIWCITLDRAGPGLPGSWHSIPNAAHLQVGDESGSSHSLDWKKGMEQKREWEGEWWARASHTPSPFFLSLLLFQSGEWNKEQWRWVGRYLPNMLPKETTSEGLMNGLAVNFIAENNKRIRLQS